MVVHATTCQFATSIQKFVGRAYYLNSETIPPAFLLASEC